MTDDGRLELDDAGDVVEGRGARSTPVDLSEPAGTDPRRPALGPWVSAVTTRWVRGHRRAAAVLAFVLAASLSVAWWSTRPEASAPPRVLTLEDAPIAGADLGGPRIDATGHLSVAYAARAAPGLASVEVLGLRGPGLAASTIQAGAATVPGSGLAFVQLGAQVVCSDRSIVSSVPSSYGLLVRAFRADGIVAGDAVEPFDDSTTALDIAVRNSCLATELPALVSIASASVSGGDGTSVAELTLAVRNDAGVPLTISAARTAGTTVRPDPSQTVLLPPHGGGTVREGLLERGCAGPVVGPGDPVPTGPAVVTLRVGLGTESTLASYPLPWTAAELTRRLAAIAAAPAAPTATGACRHR